MGVWVVHGIGKEGFMLVVFQALVFWDEGDFGLWTDDSRLKVFWEILFGSVSKIFHKLED